MAFRLGNEEYGIRIQQIREVTLTPPVSKMPKTPQFISGIANIRGNILAVMNLEERFGLEPTAHTGQSFTLVVENEEYSVGIVVPEVPQSMAVPVSQIDRTPALFKELNVDQNYIEGIGKLNDRLIIILDVEKILTTEEVKELSSV